MLELPVINLSEAFGTKLAIGLLTFATAATSGVAGYKIVKTVSAQTPPHVEAVEVPKEDAEVETEGTVSIQPQVTPTPTTKPASAQVSGSGTAKQSPVVSGLLSIGDDEDDDEDDDDKKEYEMEMKESEEVHDDESNTEEKVEIETHVEDSLTR